jgi:hypothetical protein
MGRLASLAAAALLLLWQLHVYANEAEVFFDFHAFYCASRAAVHGQNPYLISAIHLCEYARAPLGLYHVPKTLTVPAPLPAYALAMFVPIALLPYPAAAVLWIGALVAATFVCGWALGSLLNRPTHTAVWAFLPGFLLMAIPYGEVVPIVIAALLCMALALRRERWSVAAFCGAVALIEPHIGLPALAGVFVAMRPMRGRLIAAAVALGLLDLLFGGPGTALRYFTEVLPAHAQSEIGNAYQYSMTWALDALRFSDRAALLGGEISYIVMCALGIFAGFVLTVRHRDRAFAVLMPPAFAVLGGAFVHYTQIMVAIPAALLAYEYADRRMRVFAGAVALLLVIPWPQCLTQRPSIALFVAVVALLAVTVLRWSTREGVWAALAVVAIWAAIIVTSAHYGPQPSGIAHPVAPRDLAESSWEMDVRLHLASIGVLWWIVKTPTWLGLIALSFGGLTALERRARMAI